jgi:hypothetical protein
MGFAYIFLGRVLKAQGEEAPAQRLQERGSAILHMNPL